MPEQLPVGVIGIGLMGEVCARRLLDAGFAVMGHDIDAAKNARLEKMGGRAAALADIAEKCDPIVLCVFSTDQVEDVIERALLPAAAGKIVMVTSTCDPDRIAALGARVESKYVSSKRRCQGRANRCGAARASASSAAMRRSRMLPHRCSMRCSRAFSHRQGRRRRAREACSQSYSWPQSPCARRRARVRRAARARSGGVFARRAAARQRHRR